jgi:hypothetical protein
VNQFLFSECFVFTLRPSFHKEMTGQVFMSLYFDKQETGNLSLIYILCRVCVCARACRVLQVYSVLGRDVKVPT